MIRINPQKRVDSSYSADVNIVSYSNATKLATVAE